MRHHPKSETSILVEVGAGELIDKITILQIKLQRVKDSAKLINIRHEHNVLVAAQKKAMGNKFDVTALEKKLFAINEALWDIEDEIRTCELRKDFGARFIALARAVYQTNDKRADLKKEINTLVGSTVVEEKSYAKSV